MMAYESALRLLAHLENPKPAGMPDVKSVAAAPVRPCVPTMSSCAAAMLHARPMNLCMVACTMSSWPMLHAPHAQV